MSLLVLELPAPSPTQRTQRLKRKLHSSKFALKWTGAPDKTTILFQGPLWASMFIWGRVSTPKHDYGSLLVFVLACHRTAFSFGTLDPLGKMRAHCKNHFPPKPRDKGSLHDGAPTLGHVSSLFYSSYYRDSELRISVLRPLQMMMAQLPAFHTGVLEPKQWEATETNRGGRFFGPYWGALDPLGRLMRTLDTSCQLQTCPIPTQRESEHPLREPDNSLSKDPQCIDTAM